MRNFKRFTLVIILLLVGMVVLGFVLENQVQVPLSFYGWVIISLPVALLVLASLLVGAFLGGGMIWLSMLQRARRLR